ncbi:hypothetical protein AOQ84DRAFT_308906, partial [Glonium stellatum]
MFKKKPNIKPLAPLKSSDRRRTADQIISHLGIEVPVNHDADPEDKAASAAPLTALRKSLLPENALSARFTTTSGPDLKQVSGTVYVGSHDGEEQRILWVKAEDKMYPTVYTLWRNPGILPLLYTPLAVVEKIQGGADLMTPGLQRGPPFPAKAKKGAIVAVASLESPTVPMAVGTCEIDVSALGDVRGVKGHAVQTFHWAGDEIWSWSTSAKPGGDPPEYLEGWDDERKENSSLAEQVDDLNLEGADQEDGGVSLDADATTERSQAEQAQGLEGEDAPSNKDFIEEVEDKELSTKEIDDAFKNAFLYGVRHHMDLNKSQPNFGLDFPLSQSAVMSTLVQPFLPAYTPARAASLQIKKSSWKNLKKFVKYLDKQQIVKSKDRDGNEVVILDIDFKDHQIANFTPYRLPKKDTPSSTTTSGPNSKPSAPLDASDPSIGQKLKLVSLLRPKEKLAPLFAAAHADPRAFYTAAELRPILAAYIDAEHLVAPTNKRLVTLNPLLANTLFTSSPSSSAAAALDAQALAAGAVPRDVLGS